MYKTLALGVLMFVNCKPAPAPSQVVMAPPPRVENLNPFLEEIRHKYGLPGIVAAVFNADSIIAVGSAGTRKAGSGVPLIYTDKLQIASISKTMTATVVARLIDNKQLSWNSTLADLYPELAATMYPTYRNVTVEMLLQHSGGVPRWMRNADVFKSWERKYQNLDAAGKRYEAVKHILSRPTEYPPGERQYYTNDSFLILGNICERLARKSCETLFREYIFQPLKMSSFGFGEPWVDRSIDNPWGHEKRGNRFVPVQPFRKNDGSIPFGTPYGGIVHGSAVDLAKYGIFHLRGDLGLDTTLSLATFLKLHHASPRTIPPATEVTGNGFFNEGKTDSRGRWLNVQHWGYYGVGRTLFWFSPQEKIGVVILTNGTDDDEAAGMRPISETVIGLIGRFRVSVTIKE